MDMESRFKALETAVAEMQSRPAGAADPAIESRIAELEQQARDGVEWANTAQARIEALESVVEQPPPEPPPQPPEESTNE